MNRVIIDYQDNSFEYINATDESVANFINQIQNTLGYTNGVAVIKGLDKDSKDRTLVVQPTLIKQIVIGPK